MISPGLCIVRLRHKTTARRLIGRHIHVGNKELRLHAYPLYPPQTFTAEVLYNDGSGIDSESLRRTITELFAEASFEVHVDDLEEEQLAHIFVAFACPVKTLCFDIGIQTVGGQHLMAHFHPTSKFRLYSDGWAVKDSFEVCDASETVSSCGSSCWGSCGSSVSSSSSTKVSSWG